MCALSTASCQIFFKFCQKKIKRLVNYSILLNTEELVKWNKEYRLTKMNKP